MMFLHKISALLYDPLDYIRQIKLRYFLLIIALFAPGFAHAADLFDIPSQDISIKMLNALFGELVEHNIGNKGDPILEPIKALNSGALIVGGILAAYTILAGTVGTAHDGQMLGKKLSSVWVPIRYSIGTALVLPVIGGGYCVIQLLVVWVIVQGIGLAGTVWTAYVGSSTQMLPDNTKNILDVAAVEELAGFIIRAHACNAMFAKHRDETLQTYQNTSGTSANQATGNALTESAANQWGTWDYNNGTKVVGKVFGQKSDNTSSVAKALYAIAGSSKVNNINWTYSGKCGYIKYSINENEQSYYESTPSVYSGYLGTEVSMGFVPIDTSSVLNLHNAQVRSMIGSLEPISYSMIRNENFGESDAKALVSHATGLATGYLTNLQAASTALHGTDSWQSMKEQASSQGWMLAGAWFTRILTMNNHIRSAVGSYPVFNESYSPTFNNLSTEGLLSSDYQKDRKKIILVLEAFKTENSLAIAEKLAQANSDANKEKAKTAGAERQNDTGSGIFNKFIQKVLSAATTIDMTEIHNDNRHPVLMLSEMGYRIIHAIAIMTVVVAGIGAIPFLGIGVLTAIQTFLGLPLTGIVIIAITAEFVIPNLPYLIWLGALVGWLLLVLESVIAAPLWAIMHLHPNGDDLTGRGADGYKLILSLIFRPVLMVFGFIGALLISSIMGEFINKTFYSVFKNSTTGATGLSTLIGWIMGLFLYVSLMLTFVKQTFSIIHKLPDQLMRWMGGSTGGLGDMASGFQDSAEKSSAGAAALGGLAVTSGVKGTALGINKAAHGYLKKSSNGAVDTANGIAAPSRLQRAAAGLTRAMDQKGGVSSEKNGGSQTLRSVQGQSRREKQEDNASMANSIRGTAADLPSPSTVDQAGATPPGLGGINPPAKD